MKLISWNVNGFRACLQKGFEAFFKAADADIFCLQETKLQEGQIIIDGQWTTEVPDSYTMTYDPQQKLYTASILQKQGYYSYQYLWIKTDGTSHPVPSEGKFYQTENRYQALVYFKGVGERTWRLMAYNQITLR